MIDVSKDAAASSAATFSLRGKTPHLPPRTPGEYASDRIAAVVGPGGSSSFNRRYLHSGCY
jgi:hypothetical protein